jgi:ATP-dependent DNA ligase
MRRAAFPDWLDPMAPTLTHERFSGPEWIFERKFDGIRLLAYRRGRQVRLLSRNRLPQHHPAIAAALLALPVHDVILDGEVAWRGGSAYHVFDILWLDGEQVASRPLQDRRELLARLPFAAPLRRVAEITGPKPCERACAEGWEGVVAKRRVRSYARRRDHPSGKDHVSGRRHHERRARRLLRGGGAAPSFIFFFYSEAHALSS